MGKIIEAADLPEGEKIYLKKDFLGWRVIEPWRNPNGKLNLTNVFFGGKKGIFFLIIVLIIVFLLYFGINELVAQYKIIADSPCDFCTDCFEQTRKVLKDINNMELGINLTKINETLWGADLKPS